MFRAGPQTSEAFKAEELNQAQQQEIVAEPGHGAGERDFPALGQQQFDKTQRERQNVERMSHRGGVAPPTTAVRFRARMGVRDPNWRNGRACATNVPLAETPQAR